MSSSERASLCDISCSFNSVGIELFLMKWEVFAKSSSLLFLFVNFLFVYISFVGVPTVQ